MKVLIMADGKGQRWNNHNGISKHFIQIDGETLLERMIRLISKYTSNIIITSCDKRYDFSGANRIEPIGNTEEIDRFDLNLIESDMFYFYGDVYFTENAVDKIFSIRDEDFMFFGRFGSSVITGKNGPELFAVFVRNVDIFKSGCKFVREYGIKTRMRAIGWELYRHLTGTSLHKHEMKGKFTEINDETEDFDYPVDLQNFLVSRQARMKKVII